MKRIYFMCCCLFPLLAFADAGFNIGRPKAPCYAVFKGLNKIPEYEFLKISKLDERREEHLNDSSFLIHENDSFPIYYTEGRRYWQRPVKILARDKRTGQLVDSFTLVAEGYNLTINYTGVENNIPRYTIAKTKSDYPYALYGSENVNDAVARRNKYILIAMSITGFLLLSFMIYKRRNNSNTKTV